MTTIPTSQLSDDHGISRRRAEPGTAKGLHLNALDGVRGLAIIMVMCSHVFPANYGAGGRISALLGQIFVFGARGVDLFFTLSGFLITGILVDSIGEQGYFRNFYARRVLRIFPLYYAYLGMVLLATPLLHLDWHGTALYFLTYLENYKPEMHNLDVGFFPVGHFWSLAIEEQFYFVWPAAVFLVRRRRSVFVLALCGAQ